MVEDSTQTRCLARVLSAPPPSPSRVVRRRTPRSSSLPLRLFGCRPPSRPRSSCHANGTSDRSLEDATELIVYSCSFVFTAKGRLYLQRWVSIHAVYCTIAFKTVRLDSNKSRDRLPRAITDCFNHERSNIYPFAFERHRSREFSALQRAFILLEWRACNHRTAPVPHRSTVALSKQAPSDLPGFYVSPPMSVGRNPARPLLSQSASPSG